MRQNGSNLNGRSGARPTARRDLGQLPSGQRKRHRKPGAMYLNHSRGFSDCSARIGNSRTPRRSSRLPYALIAVGCALVLFIAAVVGYVNRSVDVELNGQKTAVRVGSTLQNLIDEQDLTGTYDAGDLLAVDDSVLKRHGGEKLSVKVDGKRVKQGKWGSRELEGGEMAVTPTRSTRFRLRLSSPSSRSRARALSSMCRHGVSRADPRCGLVSSRARRKTAARLCPPPIALLRAPAWRPRATKSTWH